jgi:NADH dehydrogenase (ubiquinone) 1 alpha/beta subcomplex 1
LSARGYAASAGLSKDDISSRVLEVMKTFEKVDGGKVGQLLEGRM